MFNMLQNTLYLPYYIFTFGKYDKRLILKGVNRFGIFLFFWRFIKYLSSFLNILINSFIFIDLYSVIRNPFKPRDSFNKKFLFVIMISVVFFMLLFWMFRDELTNNLMVGANESNDGNETNSFLLYLTTVILFSIIGHATYSTIRVFFALRRQGTSSELRSMLFNRHFAYFVVYIIILIDNL